MRFFRTIISISIITIVASLYVHQQIELVKLSYAIEYKEKKVKDMLDLKESLSYNIKNLEAPSRLEQVLLSKNINITFPKRCNVIKAAKRPFGFKMEENISRIARLEKKTGPIAGIFEFFSPRAEAQVKER